MRVRGQGGSVGLQTLNNGRSSPVTFPYSPKISSRCPRCTFLLKPETTITRCPPADFEPFAFADLDLDLDLDLDIETSEPRRFLGGGDGDSDFGVRDLPLSMFDVK